MFDDLGTIEPEVLAVDELHARIAGHQFELLRAIARLDRAEVWREWGARDTAHLVAMRYDVSEWKARRLIGAAHALERLPILSGALVSGELGLDKVVELCRFASPSNEARLLRWARGVSTAAVRHRADREVARDIEQVREVHATRSLVWGYHDEGRRFELHADMPAECGPVVIRSLEREADLVPVMPGEEDRRYAEARRADALFALCSARVARDPDPDRTNVVVHTELKGLQAGTGGCEVESGPVLHPETVRRLLCNARVQTVVEGELGEVVAASSIRRDPPAWMLRQLRWRDRECRFPGCGARRYTEAHHVRWWGHGGPTELSNLALICSFHHRLVHEHGWSVGREADGELVWCRPNGVRYRAGPSHNDANRRAVVRADARRAYPGGSSQPFVHSFGSAASFLP